MSRCMPHSLFWDVTRRRLVVIYRCFGTTYRSHLQGSSSPRTVNLHWVTFQNNKALSLGTHCTGSLVGSVVGAKECDNLALTTIRSPNRAACTESLYRLSYPGTWIYGRRMKYDFGALQKPNVYFGGVGRGRTKVLHSLLALHICSLR